MREIDVAVAHPPTDAVNRDDAVDRRRRRAERDERVHIRRAVEERLEAHAEELEVHEDHGQQEQELGKREREHILMAQEELGQGPSEHVPHGQVEQGDGEHERHDEPHAHVRRLLCGGVFPRGGRRGRTTRRAGSGGGLDSRHGSVARLLDCRTDRSERGGIAVVFHLHRVLQQVHHSVLDAGNTRSRLLDAG